MALEIVIHPIAECHRPMNSEEFKEHKKDVKDNGFINQVRYVKKKKTAEVFDGRNRLKACKELGLDPWKEKTSEGLSLMLEVEIPKDADELEFLSQLAESLNGKRRHETASDRAVAGENLLALLEARKEEAEADPESAPEPDKGPLREKAAKATKSSPSNVQNAKKLKKEAPDIFAKVKAGELKINQGIKELKERNQQAAMEEASAKSAKLVKAFPNLQVIEHSDCLVGLKANENKIDFLFTDPPYNQGVNYGEGKDADNLPVSEYYKWLKSVWAASFAALTKFGSALIVMPSEHAAETDMALQEVGFHIRARLIMKEDFGVYLKDNFGKCHRNAFYCVKDRKKFTFNRGPLLVESERQRLNDPRAQPDGKIMGDVIDYKRICGTFKERIEGFPTQLSIVFVQMMVEAMSLPGDKVCDPFSGSGTTAEACLWAIAGQREFIGFEKSAKYVELSRQRLDASREKFLERKAKEEAA